MVMDLREYFQRRCSEMLVMEREVWRLTNLMAQECRDASLKTLFENRNLPARHRISNLEQIVDRLGGIVGPEDDPLTLAILRRHRLWVEEHPPQALLDVHDMLEGDMLAHLAIAGYRALLAVARQLDEAAIAELLEENLRNEDELHAALTRRTPELLRELDQQLRRAA